MHLLFYLILGLVFLGFAVKANSRRQFVITPSVKQVRKASPFSHVILALPLICWCLVSWLLLSALADPVKTRHETVLSVSGKEAMVCVDSSTSMAEGIEGISAMERIRVMLHDFVEQRLDKGDFVGVSAFGGQASSQRGYGNSRVIQYPTTDRQIVHGAVDVLDPTMFGPFTAIGDGVFVSLMALLEPIIEESLGQEYNRKRLQDAIWDIGTEREDRSYLDRIIAAVGSLKGRYIVLFTDGIYNTGLNPAKPIWLVGRLGIKIYFIAFASTAKTGLNHYEGIRRKTMTIEAVLKAGGMYRESSNIDGVAQLFEEIDEIEKISINLEKTTVKESYRRFLVYGAAIVFCIWLGCWLVRSDPL